MLDFLLAGVGGRVKASVASTQGNINTSGEIRIISKLILSHKHKLVLFLRHWGHDQAIGDRISIMLSSFSLIRQTERTFQWMEMNSESFFGSRQACLQFCGQNRKIDELLLILIMASLSVPLTLNARGPKEKKKRGGEKSKTKECQRTLWGDRKFVGRHQRTAARQNRHVQDGRPPQRVGMQFIRQPL